MPEEDLIKSRKKKAENLKRKGINLYPSVSEKDSKIEDILNSFKKFENKKIKIVGRVINLRGHGKLYFLDLRDESGKIQLFCSQKEMSKSFNLIEDIDLGDFIQVRGTCFITKRGEKSIKVSGFEIISKSMRPLPEKFHGLKNIEERHRKRYLDLLANDEAIETFRIRDKAITEIRKYLKNNDFVEVETPILQPLYGGALARPFTTNHHVLKENLYLRIAPELYLKRLVVGGMERIFEIGKNFRNEGVSTTHNPEFTMLELYIAYFDYKELMKFTEKMIADVIDKTIGKKEISYMGKKIKSKTPFKIIRYRDMLKKYSGIDISYANNLKKLKDEIKKKKIKIKISVDDSWAKTVDELFKETTKKNILEPTFVIDYPVELNPLAKRKADDPKTIERFQLYIGGLEIGNAFSELNDPEDQLQRFKDQERFSEDEKHEVDYDYIEALEYGMPPTAGLGIGIDRLVMLLTKNESIRDVILFPALKRKKYKKGNLL